MKKIVPKIIFGVMILGTLLGAYKGYSIGLDETINEHIVQCIKGFGEGNFLQKNAKDFCTCNANFMRDNPSANKEDPAVKAKIGANLRQCMDKYNKKTILDECTKMNATMIKANGAYIVGCDCFYEALVDPMLKQWVGGKISSKELENSTQKMALDSLNACMKMR